jgi:hypothetical protein
MRSLNIKPTILELNQYYEKNKKEGLYLVLKNMKLQIALKQFQT